MRLTLCKLTAIYALTVATAALWRAHSSLMLRQYRANAVMLWRIK